MGIAGGGQREEQVTSVPGQEEAVRPRRGVLLGAPHHLPPHRARALQSLHQHLWSKTCVPQNLCVTDLAPPYLSQKLHCRKAVTDEGSDAGVL